MIRVNSLIPKDRSVSRTLNTTPYDTQDQCKNSANFHQSMRYLGGRNSGAPDPPTALPDPPCTPSITAHQIFQKIEYRVRLGRRRG